MGSLFSSSSNGKKGVTNSSPVNREIKREVTSKDRAVLDLKIARDKLSKYQKKTELDAQKLNAQAMEYIKGGRTDRALFVLKLKKHKLKEVDSVDSKLFVIMKMIDDVEWETHNIEVLNALKAGTAALNKMHNEMPVDRVLEILEESNDAIAVENEINEALGSQFSTIDDGELEAELEALMEKEDKAGKTETPYTSHDVPSPNLTFPEVPTSPILPAVPTHAVVVDVMEERHIDARANMSISA